MTVEWHDVQTPPALPGLLWRAACKRKITGQTLPNDGLRCRLKINAEALQRYRQVCGFTDNGLLPPTYPHVLAFPLQMQLLTAKDSPFPLVGLIHLHNHIRLLRPLGGLSEVRISVQMDNLRAHAKGALFDVVITMEDRLGPLWQGVSSFLCRDVVVPGPSAAETVEPQQVLNELTRWTVPADIGRRYAKVAGDYNPIHLSAMSAKWFGFPQAIAHGLWLKARTLAALEGVLPSAGVAIATTFQKPVRLPAEVILLASAAGSSGAFVVQGENPDLVHMNGNWQPYQAQ